MEASSMYRGSGKWARPNTIDAIPQPARGPSHRARRFCSSPRKRNSSKIGVETTHRFAKSGEYHMLVTDDGIEDDERKALEDTGVEVVIA